MLIDILSILAVIAVVFLIYVALQPPGFRVTRAATVAAPPGVVFAQVNDLRKFQAWSPWAKLDPGAKNTFEGPAEGTGAVFRWAGNAKVGEGSMTTIASKPGELVSFRLDFLKPFAGTNTADFTFKPEGNQTVVTWDMTGKRNFICKAMCLFMSMDNMIGGQFEKGLADLKSISETAAGK